MVSARRINLLVSDDDRLAPDRIGMGASLFTGKRGTRCMDEQLDA
jgi:hypothetical protein